MGVQTRKRNPIFIPEEIYLPPNTEGFIRIPADPNAVQIGGDEIPNIDGTYNPPGDAGQLLPPVFITLVSQTIKTSPSGTQVVDVLFEIEDVAGATGYEYRLAAA